MALLFSGALPNSYNIHVWLLNGDELVGLEAGSIWFVWIHVNICGSSWETSCWAVALSLVSILGSLCLNYLVKYIHACMHTCIYTSCRRRMSCTLHFGVIMVLLSCKRPFSSLIVKHGIGEGIAMYVCMYVFNHSYFLCLGMISVRENRSWLINYHQSCLLPNFKNIIRP